MSRTAATVLCCAILAMGMASAQTPAPDRGTVLITGSNRGLGLEFVKQYAARGWTVIATARDPQGATELRAFADTHKSVTIEKLDVLDRAAITALAAKYRGTPVDIVVNNAGVLGDLQKQKLGTFDYDEFEQVMAVNAYAPLAISEAFREHVASSREKKIVSVTSGSGMISVPGNLGPYFYRASKVSLNMFMKILANDLRASGVIVGVIGPGTADTDMRRALVGAAAANDQRPEAAVAAMIKVIDGLTPEQSGLPFNYNGKQMPW